MKRLALVCMFLMSHSFALANEKSREEIEAALRSLIKKVPSQLQTEAEEPVDTYWVWANCQSSNCNMEKANAWAAIRSKPERFPLLQDVHAELQAIAFASQFRALSPKENHSVIHEGKLVFSPDSFPELIRNSLGNLLILIDLSAGKNEDASGAFITSLQLIQALLSTPNTQSMSVGVFFMKQISEYVAMDDFFQNFDAETRQRIEAQLLEIKNINAQDTFSGEYQETWDIRLNESNKHRTGLMYAQSKAASTKVYQQSQLIFERKPSDWLKEVSRKIFEHKKQKIMSMELSYWIVLEAHIRIDQETDRIIHQLNRE